jgi:hypothetical protein
MAELIPLEYRIEVARKRLAGRWLIAGILAATVATGSLVTAYCWQRQKAREYGAEQLAFQKISDLINRARAIEAKRQTLAARMEKLQDLRDDNVLLSLLKGVSESLSDNDCLSFLQISAHSAERGSRSKETGPFYQVRLQGITNNDATHSKFLERLTEIGRKTSPPLSVPLGEKQLRQMMNTDVTFFDITCEPPAAKTR